MTPIHLPYTHCFGLSIAQSIILSLFSEQTLFSGALLDTNRFILMNGGMEEIMITPKIG